MQREFLQEKSLNRSLDNAEKSLNVDLSAKSKLIPYSIAASMLGLNDLYIEERDACENYRMVFTVNPICTNVLFNAVTEPVYKEGSYSAITLVESGLTPVYKDNSDDRGIFEFGTLNQSATTEGELIVDQIGAVRDTEYSHEKIGNFKYHCGYDIFNNHLLRTDDFEHVKMESNNENEEMFNTIFDFAIDHSGKTVTRVIGESDGPLMVHPSLAREKVRMYQLDNIKTINKAFFDEMRTVDGWFGFYNTGYINIPNGKLGDEEVSINRILNNEAPCGFIDLYPDRSLYSFIPKVNRFKKRLERNWDCGIVYPYKSDYDMFNRVMLNFSGTSEEWEDPETSEGWKKDNPNKIPNAVRVLNAKITYNNVGDEIIEMHSLLRHTLQPGDTVRIFYTTSDYTEGKYNEIFRYSIPIRIVSIGDVKGEDTNKFFCVKLYDFNTFCGVLEEEQTDAYGNVKKSKRLVLKNPDGTLSEDSVQFFYRKIENGCDDKYYFRKFKLFKYFEYVQIPDCQKIQDNPLIETKCTEEEWEDFNEAQNAPRVIKVPTVVNENNPKYIRIGNDYFKKMTRPLTYTQNKIAFAENIFGDRVAQVIFNDDISITGLKDNLGRPLSSLYFTVVKTNRGHKEWYYSGITSADTVEYSHCFGEVTSGLDLSENSGSTNYNVRKLYNVFSGECQDQEEYLEGLMLALEDAPVGNYIDGTPLPIETDITLDDFDDFYGDIIEFNRTDFTETTIEKVYHRFNTAQRECLMNKNYYDIFYDELVGDLFDVSQGEAGGNIDWTPIPNSDENEPGGNPGGGNDPGTDPGGNPGGGNDPGGGTGGHTIYNTDNAVEYNVKSAKTTILNGHTITLYPGGPNLYLKKGNTLTIKANNLRGGETASWRIDTENIISWTATPPVGATEVTIQANSVGEGKLTFQVDYVNDKTGEPETKTVKLTVSVKDNIVLCNRITIYPSSLELKKGESKQIYATVSPSNVTFHGYTWDVPQGAVATVSNTGLVTGVRTGGSRIIADSADGNATAWISVTVTE